MPHPGALVLSLCLALPVGAGEITVAVAANFLTTAEALAGRFTYATGHDVRIAHGSTGRLYAQIVAGAPFDLFLSADAERPALLLAAGQAPRVETYALGRLAMASRGAAASDPAAVLRAASRVAIADPDVAPFGAAALAAIRALGVDPDDLSLVYGDSVGQAAALFATGNADVALLPLSLVPDLGPDTASLPLDDWAGPIRQDAALLGRDPVAAAFLDWITGPEARAMIAGAGYGLP